MLRFEPGLNTDTFKIEMSERFAVKIWKTARFSEMRIPYNSLK
jgi:valyl-tRNA synthetase